MSSLARAEKVLFPRPTIGLNAGAESGVTQARVLVFWIIHIPLGLALYNLGSFALIHPVVVVAVGMYWAVNTRVPIYKVALVVAYLVTTEVLWRMAQIPVFWEIGKYGSVAIMVTALVLRGTKRVPPLPILYIVALVPSCFLTLAAYSLSDAREHLSFNLSGPLSLAVFCVFFANTRMQPKQIKDLLLIAMAPIISVATATLFYTISADEITFTTESNFATSGGFGPNQVSSILGLGAFFAISVLLLFKDANRFQRFLVAVLAIFFSMQSVMTFSRSGMYNVVGATIVLMFFHLQSIGEGVKRMVPIVLLGLIFVFLVFPRLDNFTGGKLQDRFEEAGTTNRMAIIESDFAMFADHPLTGVGVGLSNRVRRQYVGFGSSSHTEFSRLISEHGAFGLVALLCIVIGLILTFTEKTSILGRALVAGLATWSFLYMLNAGMRLAAPGFVIGLAFVTIVHPRLRRLRRVWFPRRARPEERIEVEENRNE